LLGLAFSPTAPPRFGTPAAWITLVDDSVLLAKAYTVNGTQARVTLLAGDEIEVPTRAIDNVRFREHSGALVEQWTDIAKTDRGGDLIVIRKNDALDFLSGVLRDVTEDTVQFELDGEVHRIKRTKADGLFFHASGRAAVVDAPALVTDVAGSQLRAATMSLADGVLRVSTAAGVEIACPLTEVVRIDFSQGNLQYLGDLKPEATVWTPYFGSAETSPARELFRPRVDQSLDGGPLRLDGQEYAKGIAVHSRTEITYRLPEKFRTFQALAGIDDRLRPGGNVRLVILGDDRTLFEETLSGKDPARALKLDISGVNRLKLIVDFGDATDVGDALDLCEARIVK